MKKAVHPVLFAALLLLAAYLRVTGLTWGINSGYGHERNFQPDEFVSLRGVLQIDLLAGQLKAPEAYFEGTFNYYLWAIAQAVLKFVGGKTAHAANAANPADYSELCMSVDGCPCYVTSAQLLLCFSRSEKRLGASIRL